MVLLIPKKRTIAEVVPSSKATEEVIQSFVDGATSSSSNPDEKVVNMAAPSLIWTDLMNSWFPAVNSYCHVIWTHCFKKVVWL